MIKLPLFILILAILIMPILSLAQGTPLVPCGTEVYPDGTVINGRDVSGTVSNPCGFTHFMTLINRIISFVLFYMAVPIAAIMFAYAGFLLVTAGSEAAGVRNRAKKIFSNALIGLVLAAAAWLIVRTLLWILGYRDINLFFS